MVAPEWRPAADGAFAEVKTIWNIGGRPIRILKDITVKYELEGNGSVVVSEEGILLKHETSGPVVWKNFQIIPKVWL